MLKPAEMAKLAATAMDEKMAKEITVMRTTDVTVQIGRASCRERV